MQLTHSCLPVWSPECRVQVNLLRPAKEWLCSRGRSSKARTPLTVVRADVFAIDGGTRELVATMLGTMMCLRMSFVLGLWLMAQIGSDQSCGSDPRSGFHTQLQAVGKGQSGSFFKVTYST
jgi:hypothetical protein